jgi:Uncharacterized conserved protein (DUF2075)
LHPLEGNYLAAYCRRTVAEFLKASPSEILGDLTDGNTRFGFPDLGREQIEAWQEEIVWLREQLSKLCRTSPEASYWGLLLEFPIPRRQHRIDAVLLSGNLIFVLEFKNWTNPSLSSAARQAEDYALDLAYFHAPSHAQTIVPVVIAPGALYKMSRDTGSNVRCVATAPPNQLGALLLDIYAAEKGEQSSQIDLRSWDEGIYRPVPTVIEAAMALYAGMSVREIARSHAGEANLTAIADFLLQKIVEAQTSREKVICFITGIPGAGKTLAGLNLVHNREIQEAGRPSSVFMSGNGPLVEILREALAIDWAQRTGKTKHKARLHVRTSVQNIHHFVKDNLERERSQLPHEKAIVFDEAQRAWDAQQNSKKYKKRSPAWHISEPEMVLKIMDRHPDWAVVIALVGGGQEIHEGEAGLSEWGKALNEYPHWRVLASPEALKGTESVGNVALFGGGTVTERVTQEPTLHLDVCIRSHQATDLAAWVNRVLNGDASGAARLATKFSEFPIVLSRDLEQTKKWLLTNTRGERRCGLVASSGAIRLRAFGIETSMAIREAYSYPHWFLRPRGDIRSSFQLETVATEFEIQGLELDLAAVCWGGDLMWDGALQRWRALQLVGIKWKDVREPKTRRIFNKYRVLMTRAREGLAIWVPEGDPNDSTRDVDAMNDTAEYLIRCGVVPLGVGDARAHAASED